MKPYSNDLRIKIVEAYQNKEGSMRQLAKRFSVSLYFIATLLKRYKETGKVDPKPHGGGQQPKIDEERLSTLRKLTEKNADGTVEEIQKLFVSQTQIEVSRATVGRALLKIKLTRKKNCASRRTKHRKSQATSQRISQRDRECSPRKLGIYR